MTTQDVGGKKLPALAVSQASISIDKNHFSVSMGGGVISDLVGLFTDLFKGTISSQIESHVSD